MSHDPLTPGAHNYQMWTEQQSHLKRHGMPGIPGQYKYGKLHHNDCTCGSCVYTYNEHQSKPGGCLCDGCLFTRKRLALIARTEAKEYKGKGNTSMATLNMCDRCETLVKEDAMGGVGYNTGGSEAPEQGHKDLCPGCVGEFIEWLDAAPGPRERGYSKPYKREPKPKTGVEAMSSGELMQLAIERGREELDQQ